MGRRGSCAFSKEFIKGVKVSKTKEYSNDDMTVLWDASKCIHAGVCVKMLPDVYDPNGRPWIKVENATTAQLKEQIDKCPSGALSYKLNDEEEKMSDETVKVDVLENGPLIVKGNIEITNSNGEKESRAKQTAFCRCGRSANKPYCDGTHVKSDFKG